MTHTAGHTADSPLTAAEYDWQLAVGVGVSVDTVTPYAGQLWNSSGTQLLGTLIPPTEAGGPVQLKIAASGSVISFPGGTFQTSTGHVVTLSPAGEIQLQAQAGDAPITGAEVRDIGGGLIGVFDQNGNLIEVRTAPSGSAAPSFASTQAAQTQAETFAREQAAQAAKVAADAAEARRVFDEEQAEIDRELRLREARLATARDLVGIRSAEAREARTQGVSLAGEDPFRFTAIARGLAGPTGTTPSAGFKQNLAQAGSFQAPDLTGLDSNALESVIGKLSQSNVPQGSPTLGFAQGGTIGVGRTQPGDGTVAIEVGEPVNGMPNPEIVILRPDGSVEVVRKVGAAQTGGTFDFGGFGPLFRNLRQSVGFGGTPGRGVELPGFLGASNVLPSGFASMLGARQRGLGQLVSSGGPEVFMVTPEGLRHVGSRETLTEGLGRSFSEVENLSADAFARLQQGIGTGGVLGLEEARGFEQFPRSQGTFGAFGQPLTARGGLSDLAQAQPGFSQQDASRITQLIGFLPAPFKIPTSFFQTLLPAEKTALISAYRLAGVQEEDFSHLLTAPQLSFAPQRATAVG